MQVILSVFLNLLFRGRYILTTQNKKTTTDKTQKTGRQEVLKRYSTLMVKQINSKETEMTETQVQQNQTMAIEIKRPTESDDSYHESLADGSRFKLVKAWALYDENDIERYALAHGYEVEMGKDDILDLAIQIRDQEAAKTNASKAVA